MDAHANVAFRPVAKNECDAIQSYQESVQQQFAKLRESLTQEGAQQSLKRMQDSLSVWGDYAVKASAAAGERARHARPHLEQAAAALAPAASVAKGKAQAFASSAAATGSVARQRCLEYLAENGLDAACLRPDIAPETSELTLERSLSADFQPRNSDDMVFASPRSAFSFGKPDWEIDIAEHPWLFGSATRSEPQSPEEPRSSTALVAAPDVQQFLAPPLGLHQEALRLAQEQRSRFSAVHGFAR